MSTSPTEPQGEPDLRLSRELSLKPGHPPTQVPGFDAERFLGVGAYGEVWVARERNTGRRVAIKFYAHRGGLDWSLLSREVEKLAFLFADRYVVQLLGVGWDADPPYYIMEYLEQGSLADRLQRGAMAVDEAVELFRDVAVGLVHAHGKGVLHCDLKPANILLDQDGKPRMADFGQSRLSSEQLPALGTLFYMAPEQADLEAVPDARWDVYALGALLYCMLTGEPPHRTDRSVRQFEQTPSLTERLARYRRLIENAPPPTAHRQVRGVDRALADVVDRCLAADPEQRYPNVQAVLNALADRAARRARRPMVILGAVLPTLLLAGVSWFAWQGFSTAVRDSEDALAASALKSNQFAAEYVARTAASELELRYQAVGRLADELASSESFRQSVDAIAADPAARELAAEIYALQIQLSAAEPPDDDAGPDAESSSQGQHRLRELCRRYRELPSRLPVQREFAQRIPADMMPRDQVASWFFCDAEGVSTARVPEGTTIGRNFAWRSYFHGVNADWAESVRLPQAELEAMWRPAARGEEKPIRLSAIFPSQATGQWIVAVSTGVFDGPAFDGKFLGVVALTVEVGRLVELEGGKDQFAVLVDRRDGPNQGVVLQHPLFDRLLAERGRLPDRFRNYRVTAGDLPDRENPERQRDYVDPLAADPDGGAYERHWLAEMEPIRVRDHDTGLVVLVQEAYNTSIGATLSGLKSGLVRRGLSALVFVALVMVSLWWFVTRLAAKH